MYLWVGTDLLKTAKPVMAGGLQKSFDIQEKEMFSWRNTDMEDVQEKEIDLTDVIADAQETVYTIYSSVSQGSGFLYNDEGAVVTNAHVVEGAIDVSVKTMDGNEYLGTVIGYSNETDIALVDVPDLAGAAPSEMELDDHLQIGEEVIALGSPLDLENTATMGYLTGKNRNFMLDPYVYEDVFQISASIAPGSSGGPLISKDSAKVIGINSAKSLVEDSIGFSIPLFKVSGLIQEWLTNPMSEDEILDQFYDSDGDYYFDGLWEDGEGYFDGGEYSEDDSYYDYYDEHDDYWDDGYWDDFYEDDYDDDWLDDYPEDDDDTYWSDEYDDVYDEDEYTDYWDDTEPDEDDGDVENNQGNEENDDENNAEENWDEDDEENDPENENKDELSEEDDEGVNDVDTGEE